MTPNEDDEAIVCGTDGCATPATAARAEPVPMAGALDLSVVSDAICPWCYVGKRRLEQAIALMDGVRPVRVAWRPFELNPQMPKEGIERREYRMRKFGSWERSLALDAQLTEVGKSVGIDFRYDLITRTPNTFDAHRLIWLSGHLGVQDAMVETLFRGYFCEGRDIGDTGVLTELAASAGIDREQATAADPALCAPELQDDEFANATTRLAVEQALARLDVGDQRVLRLRYGDDLTQADVARRLGVPEGTAKVRLHRARGRLRTLLEDGR